jgi:hypothetical protein
MRDRSALPMLEPVLRRGFKADLWGLKALLEHHPDFRRATSTSATNDAFRAPTLELRTGFRRGTRAWRRYPLSMERVRVRVSPQWFGVRLRYACLAVAVACTLHTAACGSQTGRTASLSDFDAGPGAQGGSASEGGSSGAGGIAEPLCDTRDDGAEVLRDNLTGMGQVHLDATHLYNPFHAGGAGFPDNYVIRIYKLALEVGAPTEEIFTDEGAVHGFVLGEQHAWWAQRPTIDIAVEPDRSEWKLSRVAKTGGPEEVMIPGYVQAITPSPQGLVILRGSEDPASFRGKFQLLPWSGGAPTDLCEYGPGMDHFAANNTALVWIHYRAIETCPLSGGPASTIRAQSSSESASAFAVDSTHAFWSSSDAIYRVALAGGERETVAANSSYPPAIYPLVLQGDEIFYRDGRRIVRVPKAGGVPRDAIPPQTGSIPFFAVNATHVYWGEGDPIICLKRKRK